MPSTTGVEMEALVGASLAALTFYDMCKAITHEIVIDKTRLVGKRGGKRDFGVVDIQKAAFSDDSNLIEL